MNLEDVRGKLARLEKAAPDVFGAKIHGFRLNETCSKDRILAFEHESKVQLPQDYKEFIT